MKWSLHNLGPFTGNLYADDLYTLGSDLDLAGYNGDLVNGEEPLFAENFFSYSSYKNFKQIYQNLTLDSEIDIKEILNGKTVKYSEKFKQIQNDYLTIKNNQRLGFCFVTDNKEFLADSSVHCGTLLRAYLKFLYYRENTSTNYPSPKQGNSLIRKDNRIWLLNPSSSIEPFENSSQYEYDSLLTYFLKFTHLYIYDGNKVTNDFRNAYTMRDYRYYDMVDDVNTALWGVWQLANQMRIGDIVYIVDKKNNKMYKYKIATDFEPVSSSIDSLVRIFNEINRKNATIDNLKIFSTLSDITKQRSLIAYFDSFFVEKNGYTDYLITDNLQIKDDTYIPIFYKCYYPTRTREYNA